MQPMKPILALSALILLVAPGGANAGDVTPTVRYTTGDRSFPANAFSTATNPASTIRQTQIRVTGSNELADRFSFQYDLRYGFLYNEQVKAGIKVVSTKDGLQDQKAGLWYLLTPKADFSHSLGLSLIAPGRSGSGSPSLDSGHWALEPGYHGSSKLGFWNLTGALDVSSRVFTDGGVAQLRTHAEVSAPMMPRLRVTGSATLYRSGRLGSYDAPRDDGELSDLLRIGIQARYSVTDSIQPILGYERLLAGMGGHASDRFTVGIHYAY